MFWPKPAKADYLRFLKALSLYWAVVAVPLLALAVMSYIDPSLKAWEVPSIVAIGVLILLLAHRKAIARLWLSRRRRLAS